MFEPALLDKLFPDLARILVWGCDAKDRRSVATAHRTMADARCIIELRELEPFLEGLEGRFANFRGRPSGGWLGYALGSFGHAVFSSG
jgi:hypothetical protein